MIESAAKRRQIAARQIIYAMERSGMTRSQLAEKMGRGRSEVTKWLSGNHNFTLDLLSELSQVLGMPITGVMKASYTVVGYTDSGIGTGNLNDISSEISLFTPSTIAILREKAQRLGKTVEEYVLGLISANEDFQWPKVDFEKLESRKVSKYAGIVKITEIPEDDEKFMRIWNR